MKEKLGIRLRELMRMRIEEAIFFRLGDLVLFGWCMYILG